MKLRGMAVIVFTLLTSRVLHAHPPRRNAQIADPDYPGNFQQVGILRETGFHPWTVVVRMKSNIRFRRRMFEIDVKRDDTNGRYSDVLAVEITRLGEEPTGWMFRPGGKPPTGIQPADGKQDRVYRIEPEATRPYRFEWPFVEEGDYELRILVRDNWFGPTQAKSKGVVFLTALKIASPPMEAPGLWIASGIILVLILVVGITKTRTSRAEAGRVAP